jgi:hypothetical protein
MRHIMITSGYYDAQWRKYETGGSLNLQSLLKITLALEVPLTELFDGLGQWPTLSVEEIEKRRIVTLNLRKPEVEPMQAPEGEQIETKSARRVAKDTIVSKKRTANAKIRPGQKNDSLLGRKSAK